jgi:Tfp pilus assembly protein PilF
MLRYNSLTNAIELDPPDYAAYCNRGILKNKLNDLHGAIEDFKKADALNPDDSDTRNNLNLALKKSRRLND